MNIEITIPETLNEIILNQFQRYNNLPDSLDQEALMLNMVRIFCDVKDPNKINYRDVKEIVLNINTLLDSESDLIQRFKLGENEFGLIPDLEQMSFGEFIDLEKYVSDWDTFHQAMAVLYRPITKSSKYVYDIEEYEGSDKYSDIMKYAPMDVVYGVMVFFYRLGKELLNSTLKSLGTELTQMEKKEQISQQEVNLIKNGRGILLSISSLMKILQKSEPSLNKNSSPVLSN